MDRLTRRLVSGEPDCAYCTGEYMTKRGCSNRCELRKRQKSRLAEYEDTDLTPEEIEEMKYRIESLER